MFNRKRSENDRAESEEEIRDNENAKARGKIQEWMEILGSEDEPSPQLLRAVREERVRFDPENETFQYQLKKPVKANRSEPLERMTLCEPTTGQIDRAGARGKNRETLTGMYILSYTSGEDIQAIENIKQSDLAVIMELQGFF